MELKKQLERMINAYNDMYYNLECSHNKREPIEIIRELAMMHSNQGMKIYQFKKDNGYFNLNKINGDYR